MYTVIRASFGFKGLTQFGDCQNVNKMRLIVLRIGGINYLVYFYTCCLNLLKTLMRFQFLTASSMKMADFEVAAPCSSVEVY
jgi:hypothetical protein